MTMQTNQMTISDLLAMAREDKHLEHGRKLAPVFFTASMASGDQIKGKSQTAGFENQIELVAFVWAHLKEMNRQTLESALPEQVGVVLGIPMDNNASAHFLKANYDGTLVKSAQLTPTKFTTSGSIEKFGTIKFTDSTVISVIYDGHTSGGPVAYVAIAPKKFEMTIDGATVSYDVVTNKS